MKPASPEPEAVAKLEEAEQEELLVMPAARVMASLVG